MIPKSHPRYESLLLRDKIVKAAEKGYLADSGMIAHGRGEAFDDLIEIQDFSKELRRLFIDWKMPVSLRNRWPVIINKDGVIVYVPRYQKDFLANADENFIVKF